MARCLHHLSDRRTRAGTYAGCDREVSKRISRLDHYFHDNSIPTLEEVVDYFNGPDYNSSPDGRDHPIHLTPEERSALLAFLRIF
jgi:hypothetical protein